jgi:hypothetical protein
VGGTEVVSVVDAGVCLVVDVDTAAVAGRVVDEINGVVTTDAGLCGLAEPPITATATSVPAPPKTRTPTKPATAIVQRNPNRCTTRLNMERK